MLIRTSIRQSFRAPVRLIASFVLMALVCAFLTIGLNLQVSTEQNLEAIYDRYEVIAVPDFQGRITEDGSLCTEVAAGYAGYFPCYAEDYDLTPILQAEGVESVHVQNQFGAYVSSENMLYQSNGSFTTSDKMPEDVVIFELKGDRPVTVPGSEDGYSARTVKLDAKIHWSALGRHYQEFKLQSQLAAYWLRDHTVGEPGYALKTDYTAMRFDLGTVDENGNKDGGFILEPGKRYIAVIDYFGCIGTDAYHNYEHTVVTGSGWTMRNLTAAGSYGLIAEYTDDFWETEQGDYFRQAAEASMITIDSLTAITTDDLTAMPAFADGGVYISEGRGFTAEDHENGAKVCLVSAELAGREQWKIGDRIDLNFYETQYLFSGYASTQVSEYRGWIFDDTVVQRINMEEPAYQEGGSRFTNYPMDNFFDSGTYEIVGFYKGNVRQFVVDEFDRTNGLDPRMLILPESSVQNAPQPAISEYNTSIRIDPMKIQDFTAAMQASGLMDETPDGYQLNLTIYDHGLSEAIPGLQSMERISSMTLMLAGISAGLTVIVLSVLHILQKRREIAFLRSMGVTKGQVQVMILAGLLIVCLLGAACGAFAGQVLSEGVMEAIVSAKPQQETIDAFSPVLAETYSWESYALELESKTSLALMAWGGIACALAVACSVLVWREARKAPLLLLGTKE